jgi:CheY-like chemotaxis protein
MSAAKTPKVLVVDDDAAIRRAIVRALDGEPYTVIPAHCGEIALAILEREEIDVILSDYSMPAMNGVELLTTVRRRFPQVVRLMLTSNDEVHVFANAVSEAGVRRFFHKPWDDDELREAMRVIVNAKPRSSSTPARKPHRSHSVMRFLAKIGISE